jgi:hypothetical protein
MRKIGARWRMSMRRGRVVRDIKWGLLMGLDWKGELVHDKRVYER